MDKNINLFFSDNQNIYELLEDYIFEIIKENNE